MDWLYIPITTLNTREGQGREEDELLLYPLLATPSWGCFKFLSLSGSELEISALGHQ